ncbi:MAG: GNAT family N-acetyltransferase [Burkholderiales bacterium]|jgi:GNAT superfamily N-acetyltransferase|nr:GNAT family N-acetyltransferase [Burkholderiales bacterium]
MTDPVVRPATRADVPALLDLIRGLAEYERLSHLVEATEASLADALFGAGAHVEALLAEHGGEPVGFALYFHNFSTFLGRRGLYLEDLFVRPAHRRRGIGRALLLAVARIAHARNCGRFEWMALDWNTPAIEFYKSLGAVEHPEWRLLRVAGDALARLGTRDGQPADALPPRDWA